MPQKDTLDRVVYTCMLVSYRRLSPQFQFSLSGVTQVYLSQWLKLRQMGTHGVQMRGVLSCLVRLARGGAGTRDFCPVSAAIVSPVQNIFPQPNTISLIFPHRPAMSMTPVANNGNNIRLLRP
jgi:hypothetical protein